MVCLATGQDTRAYTEPEVSPDAGNIYDVVTFSTCSVPTQRSRLRRQRQQHMGALLSIDIELRL
jgi:hypothetical protein